MEKTDIRNYSVDDDNQNHVLEIKNNQKLAAFSSCTVKTMESYTEKFHAEYVVEQAILESSLKDSNNDINETTEEIVSSSPENESARETNEQKSKLDNEDAERKEKEKEVETSNEKEVETSNEKEVETSNEKEVESSNEKEMKEEKDYCKNSTTEDAKQEVKDNTSSSEDINDKMALEARVLAAVVMPDARSEMIELGRRKGSRQSVSSAPDSRKGSAAFVPEKDLDTILADVKATLTAVEGTPFQKKADELRVAVVGAGPAGLCAARHLLAEGIEAEVFEQCADIGGTWVYTEQIHSSNHVFPLHSSLYHDLWTNLPKETMQYPDFPYREEGHSYLPSEKVLQYLVDYADHFKLHSIIKVRHQVKSVAPLGNYWSVTVEDLSKNIEEVSLFDAVMVCSGPNTIPVYPLIEGLAKFSGKQLHSRDYRRAETYAGKTVLVVGLGPSGLDITYQLHPSAKKVYLSHNRAKDLNITFPEGVVIKPKVKSLFDKTVTFIDETEVDVDVIIYCTGYTYNFPFLTEECGLIVDQNVAPLYKHIINIEHPTMCVIGLPKYCPHQYMVDYQIRTFLSILLGRTELPSKEDMLADLEADRSKRISEGQRKKDFHKLGKERTKAYMDDLIQLGKLDPVPPVLYNLFFEAFMRAIRDFKGFRKYSYKIIDNENYSVEVLEESSQERNSES